jgi:arylsulfatase A-like enzyme/Tfp pilus assembly protein PilF
VLVAAWAVWHFAGGRRGTDGTSKPEHWVASRFPPVAGIRNVILISIDTCRADRLSCYGYPRQTTPNIDALVRDAALFKQVIAPVPMTLPSHSSTMTGTYPPVHGVRTNDGYRLAASNVTLARILRDGGYSTAAFVGGFPLDARFGLDQGFETYDGHFDKEGGKHDRRSAEEVTRQGLAWLDGYKEEAAKKPFFLFLHYYDAHSPYQPPPPFDKTFADDPYAGGIAYIDSWIGRVIARLRELNLYESTLLIIAGDHGESLGEHGERTHAFYAYQSTLRVPLVIRAPGLGGGREVQQMANLVDLVPTTLSLLGLSWPERVDGADLRECLEGKPWQGTPPTGYFESLQPAAFDCCPLQGIVEGRWKYIRAPRPELYDLAADPQEQHNLAGKETETAQRMRDCLEKMLIEMKAAAVSGDSSLVDREAAKRLAALGYAGGPVRRPEFDAAREDPKDFGPIHAKLDQATELDRNHKYAEAKKLCLEIVALRPRLVRTYTLLGDICNRQQQPDEAERWLTQALAIAKEAAKKPGLLPAAAENEVIAAIHGHLGLAMFMQGKTEQAAGELGAALAVDADSADLHYNLGNVFAARGQSEQAIARYRKAVELQPQHAEALYSLGKTLAACGRFDEALVYFRKALEVAPDNVRAEVNFADALAGHGQVDEAIVHYRRAVAIDPGDADAHNNLGLALAGRKQTGEAVEQFRKALEINPSYAAADNNLGLTLASRGRWEEAIDHYEKALKLKPDFAEAHNNLGVALAAGRGQMEAAIRHFQKALEIKPDYPGARANLEHARRKP